MKKLLILTVISLGLFIDMNGFGFGDISHAVSGAANKVSHAAQDAANAAKKAAEAAAAGAQQAAEAAAKEAQQAAAQVADEAKKAAALANNAANQAEAAAKSVTDHIGDVGQQAVGGIETAANTVNSDVFDKVKDGAEMGIAMAKGLLGKGPHPDFIKIYGGAIGKALDKYKDNKAFPTIAYKILAAMALSKELVMHTHINFGQFQQLFAHYNLSFATPAVQALQAAFEKGTAIPDGVGPKPDMSNQLITTFEGAITKQLPGFIAKFKAAFTQAGLPADYLDKNPDKLASAKNKFIAEMWEKAAPSLKRYGVTAAELQKALAQYKLPSELSSAVQKALTNAVAAAA